MFNSLRQKIEEFIHSTENTIDKKFDLSPETRVKSIIKSKIRLSEKDIEEILWKFQLDLIQNDVAVETTEGILERLRNKLLHEEIERGKIHEFVMNSLREILLEVLTPDEEIDIIERIKNSEKPFKIVFFGVNGSGKTTTVAKIAKFLMDNNLSVVFAAADTFRAGAIEQIEKHGKNLGVRTIAHQRGADAAAVVYDAIEHAKARHIDVVLADTAGRMQTNFNLMEEMKKICRVNKPHLRIFVADALTGNDAV
ncbi:MAG: signal recognition particle-docking protein FtsY, partial [Candidatus Altiarchaeales archaeon]